MLTPQQIHQIQQMISAENDRLHQRRLLEDTIARPRDAVTMDPASRYFRG